MVKIRLARSGRKKRPFYHIVAANNTSPRDGKYLERIGYYDPLISNEVEGSKINLELYEKWIKLGALPTDRVRDLVKKYKKGDVSIEPKKVKAKPAPVKEEAKQEAVAETAPKENS